jgi:hypothetical protein
MGIFRPARLNEYLEWLRKHAETGGKPTHLYNYPWATWNFLYAERDFRLGGECGANARSIVAGPNASWISGGIGHNNLFLSGGTFHGLVVPMFSDSEFKSIPGYEELLELDTRRRKEWNERRRHYEQRNIARAAGSDLSAYTRRY